MMAITSPHSFPLTALRLRFTCRAETFLQLGGLRAGSNLRGALVNVMRRATCAGDPSDKAHLAVCPVCWLVAADDHPGEERRGYAITPPSPLPHPGSSDGGGPGRGLEPGASFDFHITLFGEAARYLPYFVLAVPEAGRVGVGPGHGRFTLKSIHAEHPLTADWEVLKEGENLVRPPLEPVCHADIEKAATVLTTRLMNRQARLHLEFVTPLRLIVDNRLLKSPDFSVIFGHVLKRLDDLAMQHAGGSERSPEERQRLWDAANQVRLVESETHWEDIPSGSSRTGQKTWISGLVGAARYSAATEVWRELLPWLLWGEIAQVGKDTAKGNGAFRVKISEERG